MKYCTDCRHYRPGNPYFPWSRCNVSRYMDGQSMQPLMARQDESKCGASARHFEPKPPPKASLWQRLRAAFREDDAHE